MSWMAEALRRMREPAAWLLLGVTALYVVLDLIRFGWALVHQHVGLTAAARQTGSSVGLVWVLLDLGIVLACILISPPVRRARAVTLSAAILVSVVTVNDLFLLVAGVVGGGSAFGRVLEAIGGFLEVLCKAVIAGVLWRLAVWFRTRGDELTSPAGSEQQAGDSRRGNEPVWQRDQAVAMTWDRAGDAASGAPATGQQQDLGQAGSRQDWSRGAQGSLRSLGEGFADPASAPVRTNPPWVSAAEQAAGLSPTPPPQPDTDVPGTDPGRPTWTPLPPETK